MQAFFPSFLKLQHLHLPSPELIEVLQMIPLQWQSVVLLVAIANPLGAEISIKSMGVVNSGFFSSKV